jgi:hypothetical protein
MIIDYLAIGVLVAVVGFLAVSLLRRGRSRGSRRMRGGYPYYRREGRDSALKYGILGGTAVLVAGVIFAPALVGTLMAPVAAVAAASLKGEGFKIGSLFGKNKNKKDELSQEKLSVRNIPGNLKQMDKVGIVTKARVKGGTDKLMYGIHKKLGTFCNMEEKRASDVMKMSEARIKRTGKRFVYKNIEVYLTWVDKVRQVEERGIWFKIDEEDWSFELARLREASDFNVKENEEINLPGQSVGGFLTSISFSFVSLRLITDNDYLDDYFLKVDEDKGFVQGNLKGVFFVMQELNKELASGGISESRAHEVVAEKKNQANVTHEFSVYGDTSNMEAEVKKNKKFTSAERTSAFSARVDAEPIDNDDADFNSLLRNYSNTNVNEETVSNVAPNSDERYPWED